MHITNHISVNRQEEESKKEDAVASYEAWKEKKAEILRAKAKERNEKIRKEQQATEEKREKRESAKQVQSLFMVNPPGNYGNRMFKVHFSIY